MEYNINFDSTYFIKLVRNGTRYPYMQDWVECVIHKDGENYLRIIPCDDDVDCVRMHLVDFEQMIEDDRIIENINGNYCVKTYNCYEPLCGNAYLHHSAHYVDKI